MTKAALALSKKVDDALREFCNTIRHKLKDNIIELRLFGSVVRGETTSDSDIDVLVVLRNKDEVSEDIVLDIAVDTNLKYDVLICPIIKRESEYNYPLFQQTYFYRNLQAEGILLW
ncbi:MAG: nucleotidyltransferase domain-containing protein [Candidatus Desulforudis sp.]|nr:nucleotidyltransferase domain-containing protein [Desulforudis sp.]